MLVKLAFANVRKSARDFAVYFFTLVLGGFLRIQFHRRFLGGTKLANRRLGSRSAPF